MVYNVKQFDVLFDNYLWLNGYFKKLLKHLFLFILLYNNRHVLNKHYEKKIVFVFSYFSYCDYVYDFYFDLESKSLIKKAQNMSMCIWYDV